MDILSEEAKSTDLEGGDLIDRDQPDSLPDDRHLGGPTPAQPPTHHSHLPRTACNGNNNIMKAY